MLDQAVHELLSEDVEAPPPPYTAEYSRQTGLTLNPKNLSAAESPRPKKKSEIRTLLDATSVQADSNKPQWMMFQSHGQPGVTPETSGVDNPAYESDGAMASRVLPWKREDQEVYTMTDHKYQSPSNTMLHTRAEGEKKRSAIIGYFQKRDSLTFLGDLGGDSRSSSRRNSKEGTDLLSVLANPVNIRKHSAPPLNRQKSLSSMRVRDRKATASLLHFHFLSAF